MEANDDAEIEKKCALIDDATALASTVLPLPGGPKNKIPKKEVRHVILLENFHFNEPLGGARIPVKRSGRSSGYTIASCNVRLASSRPTARDGYIINFSIMCY